MDEPTSALSQSEVKVLFNVIEQLKRRGVTIIYISHRLEELMEIGDYITIFRDGRFISERPVNDASIPWIIEQMVGDKKNILIINPHQKVKRFYPYRVSQPFIRAAAISLMT